MDREHSFNFGNFVLALFLLGNFSSGWHPVTSFTIFYNGLMRMAEEGSVAAGPGRGEAAVAGRREPGSIRLTNRKKPSEIDLAARSMIEKECAAKDLLRFARAT